MSDYRDLRDGHPDYERHRCPECGVERWFKHLTRDRWPVDQWNCQECGAYLQDVLEYPCPDCGTRMTYEGDCFTCQVCSDAEGFHDVPINRDRLINRLTDEFETAGYQYGAMQPCPVCGERSILTGPDGERACEECNRFYVGRFTGPWFCYAMWLTDRDRIRVTTYPPGGE